MDLKIIEAQYVQNKTLFSRFEEKMCNEMTFLLENKNVTLAVPIQSRVKSLQSLMKKLTDNPKIKISSIFEVQDVYGMRIITNFSRDMEKVVSIIENSFSVQKKYNTIDRYSENEFGYASIHLVVKMPESWIALPSLSNLNTFLCEIQVRTLAQHLWANASHILQYKTEQSIPQKLQRSVNRISALLELIDEEYERILDKKAELLKENFTGKDLLNVDLLEHLLDKELPIGNKSNNEEFSELLNDLLYFKIDKIDMLCNIITKYKEEALKKEKAIVNNLVSGNTKHYYKDPERQKKGVFYTYVGLVRSMMELNFGDDWIKYRKKKSAHFS